MEPGGKIPFQSADIELGREICQQNPAAEIIFSQGTYQVQVVDSHEVDGLWVLMQLDDKGSVNDYFCSCEKGQSEGSCKHLAAAYFYIFRDKQEPLHLRFSHHFFRELFFLLHERLGPDPSLLQKNGTNYEIKSSESLEFRIEGVSKTQEALDELILSFSQNLQETEETSIKFSNLSIDEIESYKRGQPTKELSFLLSFYCDLAKWCFLMQDRGLEFRIEFEKSSSIASYINVISDEARLYVKLSQDELNHILPFMHDYRTEPEIFEFRGKKIKRVEYFEDKKAFYITYEAIKGIEGRHVINIGAFDYIDGIGFFANKVDPLFEKSEVLGDDVEDLLDNHRHLLERYLEPKLSIEAQKKNLKYKLSFDKNKNLVICAYLFTPEDFNSESNTIFKDWAYIKGSGFFQLGNRLFDGIQKVIAHKKVGDFIDYHKSWLSQIEGFNTHLTSIQTQVYYKLLEDRLSFFNEISKSSNSNMLDLGAWVYIQGQGFYSREGKGLDTKKVIETQDVPYSKIAKFIENHTEELELVHGFFTGDSGLKQSRIELRFNNNKEIESIASYEFSDEINELKPQMFDHYVYIPTRGFARIPDRLRLIGEYAKKRVIAKDQQTYFIQNELKRLKPFIYKIDPRLTEVRSIKFRVDGILRDEVNEGFLFDIQVITDVGQIGLGEVFDHFVNFEPYLFSLAGLLNLLDKRFAWLSRLNEEQFDFQKRSLRLTTIEWIRLSILQEISFNDDQSGPGCDLLGTFSGMADMHLSKMPSLKGLKSTLRPYQEIGVRWLWFLYTYGLSGFLCDDMGLGKTHQAMALICAIRNERKGKKDKILVVCPTSVIYHWQELLKNFVRGVKVRLYHGTKRKPRALNAGYDILLTSYGILRSDIKHFSNHKFILSIFDEIQVAKNQKSLIHKSLINIDATMKLALTGTPIENHLSELKALFEVIVPNFLPRDKEFKENFILPIEKNSDQKKQKVLSKLISPFILRRKKSEVLKDLPEKIEEINYIDLSEEQKILYKEFFLAQKEQIVQEVEGNQKAVYLHIFALFSKLKQICNHPCLISKDLVNYENHDSGKWDYFVELLEETIESGQKLVVFTQYLDMLKIMQLHLEKNNIQYAKIQGSTIDRKEQVDFFQKDKNCKVFLGSLQAAGVGIDLTSGSVVIHYDRWFNPAKENQATDRVHRIGQNRGVSVFKFVMKNTIEEHIHKMIVRKQGLVDQIIGYDTSDEIKKMDRGELMGLMNQVYSDIQRDFTTDEDSEE
jgi:superfamily II DNA or RNA helicase